MKRVLIATVLAGGLALIGLSGTASAHGQCGGYGGGYYGGYGRVYPSYGYGYYPRSYGYSPVYRSGYGYSRGYYGGRGVTVYNGNFGFGYRW